MSEFDALAGEARDEIYAVFGKAAGYVPPGGGAVVPCTIQVDRRDLGARPDDGRPLVGQVTIKVRTKEIAAPARGGVFTLDVSDGAATYTVANRPQPIDPNRDEWTMWAE
jgi:hypothetical protein